MDPVWLQVVTDWKGRGGIRSVIRATHDAWWTCRDADPSTMQTPRRTGTVRARGVGATRLHPARAKARAVRLV